MEGERNIYRYWRKDTKKGYKQKGYSWSKALAKFKKSGNFKNRKDGSGHRAGEEWGAKKGIDPSSSQRRYSKNSPSFDEGVYQYKSKAIQKALSNSKE